MRADGERRRVGTDREGRACKKSLVATTRRAGSPFVSAAAPLGVRRRRAPLRLFLISKMIGAGARRFDRAIVMSSDGGGNDGSFAGSIQHSTTSDRMPDRRFDGMFRVACRASYRLLCAACWACRRIFCAAYPGPPSNVLWQSTRLHASRTRAQHWSGPERRAVFRQFSAHADCERRGLDQAGGWHR